MKHLYLIILSLLSVALNAQENEKDIVQLMDKAYQLESSAPDSALALYKAIESQSKRLNLPVYEFKAIQYSGIVFSDNGQYDSAQVYYERALDVSRSTKNKIGEGSVHINLGNVYLFRSQYPEAIEHYLHGIRIYETEKDTNRLSIAYRNLSGLYREVEDYKNYDLYLNKAIEITFNPVNLGYLYNDLVKFYIDHDRLSEAEKALNRVVDFTKDIDDKRVLFFTHRNQGEFYRAKHQPVQALKYYNLALEDMQHFQDSYFEMDVYKVMSYAYIDLNNTKQAEVYILKALELAKSLKASEVIAKSYQVLAELEHLRAPDKAYELLQKGTAINDSIRQSEYYEKIAELEKSYQNQKKDIALAKQSIELEQLENQALKGKNQLYLSMLIGGVLVLVTLALIGAYKREKRLKTKEIFRLKLEKEKEKLESLLAGEEKERKRLAKDLHDGINGDLSALKFKLLSLDNSTFNETHLNIYKESIDMLDHSCSLIRHISHNLAPPSIREFGLIESVKQFSNKLQTFEKTTIDFQVYGDQIKFSETVETNIYRMVQELVLNAIKHAEANDVFVQMNFNTDQLNITVEDDGKGFDHKANHQGIGLKNIGSRVEFLNGNFEISSDAEGTTVLISFSIKHLEHYD